MVAMRDVVAAVGALGLALATLINACGGGRFQSGSADGAGGNGGEGGNSAPCDVNDLRCADTAVEICDDEGAWSMLVQCPFACVDGACTGVCVPGEQECDGETPRTCDSSGAWVEGDECPVLCVQGECADSCMPGIQQCSSGTPQTCTLDGVWADGRECEWVCSDGECTGECPPNSTRCNDTTLEVCDARGQWDAGSQCPYRCEDGRCVDDATGSGGSGSVGSGGMGGTAGAGTGTTGGEGGSCSGAACECAPGQTRCDGRCVDSSSDADHCGACNNACVSSQVCSLGTCSGAGPPSCAGMAGTECRGLSCCAVSRLPGGPFLLGRRTEVCELPCTDGCPLDEDDETVCDPDEVPERVATASSFLLETFEVTVGRFENYVAAYDAWRESGHPDEGEGAHPRIPGSGWQSAWNTLLPASASAFATALGSCSETTHGGASSELPANCVTWYDAFAFCIWDGGRLATEMEFEYAAAGGDQNRVYPWGTANPTPELSLAGVTALEDVGSRPAGNARWGHRDLGGSLYNWLFDQYAPYPETCNDCATVSSGTNRVHRGGDYDAPATRGRTANRYTDGRPPEQRLNGVGFRCARDL